MERYVCVHCHFYQPPRENPWLEAVELQDSAYPYHDWNERITAECYAPNAASRILDPDDRIVAILNNYSRISFNFGPTLLSWLEVFAPDTYRAILEADRAGAERFGGHGSALAQAYNHMILPLATRRDKITQVLWGIRDFQRRFGRDPKGMWLPECAVDNETLEVLADLGIQFTVLAPRQAARVRRIGTAEWQEVSGGGVDPSRAYRAKLPSGKSIGLFFYDGPVSQGVAFEGLLASGHRFAERLLGGLSDERAWPQLLHIATDGETYGHHHTYGEMALSFALHHIESSGAAQLTNYAQFLEKHPPQWEAEVVANSSWSCAHGVERWRADCGCNSGGHPDWNQEWRGPLRQALDWLRDEVAAPYEKQARELLRDPWAARDEYIAVVLDRSEDSLDRFFGEHATRELRPHERVRALELLELQRHAMLMYTSCGWFFDELSGIETVQVIHYAGRAVQLAQKLFRDPNIEKQFVERLAAAKSNLPHGDGAAIYQKWTKSAAVDLEKVAAHYAISSLFERYGERTSIYCYDVQPEDYHSFEFGKARLAVGRAHITSRITRETGTFSFGVLHFGDHNLSAAVRPFHHESAYGAMLAEARDAFLGADLPQALRILDKHFSGVAYSLRSLFRDEQRKIISLILDSTLAEADASLRQLYEHHAPLLRFLSDLGQPLPEVLRVTGEFVLSSQLRRAFAEEPLDVERIRTLLKVAQREQARLDAAGLGFELQQNLERMAERLRDSPGDAELAARLDSALGLARELPFEVSLWRVQNLYYEVLAQSQAAGGEQLERLRSLAEKLSLKPA
jgi:alpha-amylase/alpha-mannosidase (GH57 family)